MTQLDKLKSRLDSPLPDDGTLNNLLETALFAIVSRRYPFGGHVSDPVTGLPIIESRFAAHQINIAVFLCNKIGMEGQTGHSENGIDRRYGDSDIPISLFRGIVPYIGVPV